MPNEKLKLIGGLTTRISSKTGQKFYKGYIKSAEGQYTNFVMFKNNFKEQQIAEGQIKDPSDFCIYLSQPLAQKTAATAAPVKAAPPKPAPAAPAAPAPSVPVEDETPQEELL